jgi:hypothetical protein
LVVRLLCRAASVSPCTLRQGLQHSWALLVVRALLVLLVPLLLLW